MNKTYNLNSDLDLSLDESSNILLNINSSKINIKYDLKDGEYNILIFNNSNSNLNINEKGHLINSMCHITYIELNNYELIQNTKIDVDNDSSLFIDSIYSGVNSKNIIFDLFNMGINSSVNINNNVVCLDDSNFNLSIVGNIIKGAKNSKCRQKSSCLTFGNPKKSKILPILNIDENEVEASHALSSGTIDDEVLFYMNTRGMSRVDALKLLIQSYLIPNDDFYKTFDDGDKIKDIANKKVNDLCLI